MDALVACMLWILSLLAISFKISAWLVPIGSFLNFLEMLEMLKTPVERRIGAADIVSGLWLQGEKVILDRFTKRILTNMSWNAHAPTHCLTPSDLFYKWLLRIYFKIHPSRANQKGHLKKKLNNRGSKFEIY